MAPAPLPAAPLPGPVPPRLKDPGSDVWIKVLSSLDCKYSFEPQAIPCSITWRRNTASTLSAPDDSMVKTEEEKEMLVLVEPDFLKHRLSLTQSFVDAPAGSQPHLNQALPLARAKCNWERGRQQARSPAKQRPGSQPSHELSVTQREVLEALVVLQLWGNLVLQLWGNTDVLFLDTWQEFGKHVSALTKVIAKRPYKRQQEMHELPFCTAGTSGSRVRVEKDGTGLWQVWERQIQQFNRVSPATAAAIAEAHSSPSLLVQAYTECSNDERLLLLSDIPVKSDISGQDRRLGTDLPTTSTSSTDPDLVLDLMA
ncbi:LOW QUALITY PROTEIN: putative crossover junction endonuclease EME2 [Mergus octosetaceus]